VNLPVSYITGFFIGHLIAKRRKDESSVWIISKFLLWREREVFSLLK
jgi:hypothetical protein